MPESPGWKEMESKVWCPGRLSAAATGIFFLVSGAVVYLASRKFIPAGVPYWAMPLGTAVVALFGGAIVAWAVGSILLPSRVRHAVSDVLPKVPREPVIDDGAVVHFRLTHELHEDAQGWEFRPAAKLWRSDVALLLGFGLPFLTIFSALTAWMFHSQFHIARWPLAVLCGATVTALCGGSVWVLLGMLMRAGYRRLARLSFPRDGGNLELDSPEALNAGKTDLAAGLKWLFLGETKRYQLSIPWESVVAVQLCPWKYKAAMPRNDIIQTVQGLVVLAASEEGAYHRIPILLTADYVGAARIMEKLGRILQVPYLYCADEEGWKEEVRRAKERPALQVGGTQP
jgi:hypothetical protein